MESLGLKELGELPETVRGLMGGLPHRQNSFIVAPSGPRQQPAPAHQPKDLAGSLPVWVIACWRK